MIYRDGVGGPTMENKLDEIEVPEMIHTIQSYA